MVPSSETKSGNYDAFERLYRHQTVASLASRVDFEPLMIKTRKDFHAPIPIHRSPSTSSRRAQTPSPRRFTSPSKFHNSSSTKRKTQSAPSVRSRSQVTPPQRSRKLDYAPKNNIVDKRVGGRKAPNRPSSGKKAKSNGSKSNKNESNSPSNEIPTKKATSIEQAAGNGSEATAMIDHTTAGRETTKVEVDNHEKASVNDTDTNLLNSLLGDAEYVLEPGANEGEAEEELVFGRADTDGDDDKFLGFGVVSSDLAAQEAAMGETLRRRVEEFDAEAARSVASEHKVEEVWSVASEHKEEEVQVKVVKKFHKGNYLRDSQAILAAASEELLIDQNQLKSTEGWA